MGVALEDHLRCRRHNGNAWRCKELKVGDDIYCQKHRDYFRYNMRLTPKAHKNRKVEKLANETKQDFSSENPANETKQDLFQNSQEDGLSTGHNAIMGVRSDSAISSYLTTHDVECTVSLPSLASTLENMAEVQNESVVENKMDVEKQFHGSIPTLPSLILSVKSRKRKPKKAWEYLITEDQKHHKLLKKYERVATAQIGKKGKKLWNEVKQAASQEFVVDGRSASHVEMMGALYEVATSSPLTTHNVKLAENCGADGESTSDARMVRACDDFSSSPALTTCDVNLASRTGADGGCTSFDDMVHAQQDVPSSTALATDVVKPAEDTGADRVNVSYNDMVGARYDVPSSSALTCHDVKLAENDDMVGVQYDVPSSSALRIADRSGAEWENTNYHDMGGFQYDVPGPPALTAHSVEVAEKSEADEAQYNMSSVSALTTHAVNGVEKTEGDGGSMSDYEMMGAQFATTSSDLTTGDVKLTEKSWLQGVSSSAGAQFDNAASSALTTHDVKLAASLCALTSFISTPKNMAQVCDVPTKNIVGNKVGNVDTDFNESAPFLPVKSRKHKPMKGWNRSALIAENINIQKHQNQLSNIMTTKATKRKSILSGVKEAARVTKSDDGMGNAQFNLVTASAWTADMKSAASPPSLFSLFPALDDVLQFTEVPITCVATNKAANLKQQFVESTPSFPSLILSVKGRKRKPKKAWDDEEGRTGGTKRMKHGSTCEERAGLHELTAICNSKQAAVDGARPRVYSSGEETDWILSRSFASTSAMDRSKQQSTKNEHPTGCGVQTGRKFKSFKAPVSHSNLVEQAVTTLSSNFKGLLSNPTRAKHQQHKEEVSIGKATPLLISEMVPKRKGRNKNSKMCHQCQRNDKGEVRYCRKCCTRYPTMTKKQFEEACPVCRKNCNGKACLRMDMPKFTSLEEETRS